MDTAHDDTPVEDNDKLPSDESLPPFIAYQVGQESRENAPAAPGTAGEQYRRGKLEAETRRVSDEVTREAQKRRREAEEAARREAESTSGAAATPVVTLTFPPETTLPAPVLLRRFFVPLDGTLQGERALPYATALARLMGAHVLLGHVTPTEPPAILGQMFGADASKRQEAQQAFAPEAVPYLRQQRGYIAGDGLQVDTVHITAPTITEGLLQIEVSHSIDLAFVALGVHGAASSLKVGKVADSLIRLGKAPVLAIPPEADAGMLPFALGHIIVTLDGSPLAEQSLGPLLGLLQQLPESDRGELTVTLLAVAEDFSIQPDYQAYLDALAGTLMAQPQFAHVHLDAKAVVGSAPGAIVGAVEYGVAVTAPDAPDAADSLPPADLLIMTTHGRGGMSRWLFGSVANYVLPRVRIPVLVTRPGKATDL
ncbi:MAG: universal stress protein [Nitrososphaerota archaeon]